MTFVEFEWPVIDKCFYLCTLIKAERISGITLILFGVDVAGWVTDVEGAILLEENVPQY